MDAKKRPTLISNLLGNNTKEINGYHLQRLLGSGAFGEVYLAKKGGRQFAAKAYNHSKISRQADYAQMKRYIDAEISILKDKFDHPNIIKVHETFESANHIYLIMDYFEEGDLMKKICSTPNPTYLTESEALRLLEDITEAMCYANTKNVIHRDIKPENILIRAGRFFLADFGVAKISEKLVFTYVGTTPFMSPQILNQESYNSKCDVWSLGITVWICLFGKDPWNTYAIVDGRTRPITRLENQQKRYGSDLEFPGFPQISKPLMQIIKKMLQKKEQDRISWSQLRKELVQMKNLIASSSKPTSDMLDLSIEPIEVEAIGKSQLIGDGIRWIFCDTQIAYQAAANSDNPMLFDLAVAEDIEIIQNFLDLNSRLCNLFLMCVHSLKDLTDDPTFAPISHWIETVRAFVCIKVLRVSKYCFDRLNLNKPFTQFLSNMFHQNGFAEQYKKEFYEVVCVSSKMRIEAAYIATKKLTEKIQSDPNLKNDKSLDAYKQKIEQIMNNDMYHQEYQEYFKSVMCRALSNYSKFKSSFDQSAQSSFKQAFVLVYLAENYSETMVENAKKKQSDGFADIYGFADNRDLIEDIFEFLVEHYKKPTSK